MRQIDIEEIIRSKNPRLLKFLPLPLMRYIKRIIHQEELNDFLYRTKNHDAHDFICATLENFKMHVSSRGLEHIPNRGGCIIACNHPLGGLDGIAVMNEVSKVRPDMKALVNDLLMNLKNLSCLLVPVNKHGKNAVEASKRIDRAYASEECIIVFPAGLVSRKQSCGIKDLEWKKSFITKAIKYQRDIIPVHVEARNSNFFYNLAAFRKKIGIKTNIEMFYLVDEVYKQTGKSITLTIGAPISYKVFSKDQTDQYWAGKVREHVYTLSNEKTKL